MSGLPLASLLDGPLVALEAEESLELLSDTSDELAVVSGRILVQYVEVLASFAARTLAGGPTDDVVAVRSAIGSMRRLSGATGDRAQGRLLDELEVLLDELSRPGQRGRVLGRLRQWMAAFAAALPAEVAERMDALREGRLDDEPALDVRVAIRAAGPRQRERLYAAGVFDDETVAHADPADLAAVTGLPRGTSAKAVARAAQRAARERMRCLEMLRKYTARLASVTSTDPGGFPEHREVVEVLRGLDAILAQSRRET